MGGRCRGVRAAAKATAAGPRNPTLAHALGGCVGRGLKVNNPLPRLREGRKDLRLAVNDLIVSGLDPGHVIDQRGHRGGGSSLGCRELGDTLVENGAACRRRSCLSWVMHSRGGRP